VKGKDLAAGHLIGVYTGQQSVLAIVATAAMARVEARVIDFLLHALAVRSTTRWGFAHQNDTVSIIPCKGSWICSRKLVLGGIIFSQDSHHLGPAELFGNFFVVHEHFAKSCP